MLKRAFLLVVSFFALSVSVAFAQTSTPPPEPEYVTEGNPYGYRITVDEYAQYRQAIENCDTPSLECLVHYTTRFAAMEWVLDIAKGGIGTPTTSDNGGGGVFAGVLNLSGYMYAHPPAHTGAYIADVMDTAGFAPRAYAQGIGYSSLDPILNLWKVFRNVAYFFFIIIFVIIGFMIMLRQRISGQAAVTAQQAIPSVIISLILVTFSYAIAGFMIDLMYVLMFLIIGLFNGISFNIIGGDPLTGDNIINFNIIQLVGFLFRANMSNEAIGLNTNLVTEILNSAAGTENLATYIGGVVGGLTLTLVIAVAVLIGAVRLFFELLKSYASIIMAIVAAPIVLMMGAIPGKDVFWPWLKGIIGNLLAFPTVLLMLIIYIEFTGRGTGAVTVSGGAEGGFMPPFLMGNGTAGNLVGPLLGLAIILGLPDIVKEVKKAAGAGDGGIGMMLAGWAGKSIARGEVAIPAVTSAASYIPGGLRALERERRVEGTRDPLSLWRAFRRGSYDDVNDRYVGGANNWASTGWKKGAAVRRTIDRMKEGRFWEAEDLESTLTRIAEGQGKGSDGKNKKTEPPAGEPTS